MKNNKDYPASRLLYILAYLLLMVGILLVLIGILYQPYYKFTVNGEFIGYYKSYQEYEEIYNNINKELYINGAKMDRYLSNNPIGELVLVKTKYVKSFNNYILIENQMNEDYTIYKVLVNDEIKFYTKTEEEANTIITKIKNEVKESTNIKIEPTIVKDLSLIESEEGLKEKTNKIIEQNKKIVVTSRGGMTTRTKKSGYIWPTTSKTITSKFGNRSKGFHTGLDIGVPTGSPIYAMMSGTVILAGWNGGYGYQVKIQHSNGVITTYGHNSKILVSKGQTVSQGDVIARSGSTGNSTGPHTHIEFIINGKFVNPLNYL